MKVREVVSLMKGAKSINIAWNGLAYPLSPENALMMDAYGDYAVAQIHSLNREEYEIDIASVPVKEA